MPHHRKKVLALVERRGGDIQPGKGSHLKLKLTGTNRPFVIPRDGKDLSDVYIRSLCRWAGWDFDNFIAEL